MATLVDVTSIVFSETADSHPYSSTSTAAAIKRVAGNKDWTCTVTQKAHGDGVGFAVNAVGTLTVELRPTETTIVTTVGSIVGAAVVEAIDVDVNVETGDVVSNVITFGGTSALAYTAQAGSASIIAPQTSTAATIDWT